VIYLAVFVANILFLSVDFNILCVISIFSASVVC